MEISLQIRGRTSDAISATVSYSHKPCNNILPKSSTRWKIYLWCSASKQLHCELRDSNPCNRESKATEMRKVISHHQQGILACSWKSKPKLASLLEVESSGQYNTASRPELCWYHNSSIWKLDKEKGLLKHEQATDDPLWNFNVPWRLLQNAMSKLPHAHLSNWHLSSSRVCTAHWIHKLQKCHTKIPQRLVLSYKP